MEWIHLSRRLCTSINSSLFGAVHKASRTLLLLKCRRSSAQELQALGAKAVTVHIDFPVLYQPFYSSNPSQYQQFVSFYQQLAQDIHARGMKMIVEPSTSTSFPGSLASTFDTYFSTLSWNAYMTGRAQNALNVAQLVQPDYMSVLTEPDSESVDTGQPNVNTVSGATQLLNTILSTLKSAGATNVIVGAGAGTWINSLPNYISSFAATSVQYIDIHLYPINKSYFTDALTVANTAHAAGKQVAISEAWDYKVRDSELGKLTVVPLYGRDPFSFWGPIDQAFLGALSDFANDKQLVFISPFWSHYLFAYLDYNTWGSRSATQILNESYSAADNANMVGQFSSTGMEWMEQTDPVPDKTLPSHRCSPWGACRHQW